MRGINESAESYAARLVLWLDDRKTAGNPFALMRKLSEYTGAGCVFRTVDARGNWYTRAVDGTQTLLLAQGNWNWDDRPTDSIGRTRWSRFWVIVYPPASLWGESRLWGQGAWGDTTASIGTSALVDQVSTMRAIVADWKPAGTRCVNIIEAFDPASFDPTAAVDAAGMPGGFWEHWSRFFGNTRIPARLDTARFWDGT